MKSFDVIVAGGGHAGVEASIAAARIGVSVGLITMEKEGIGRLSCNPCIGGSAKGILVHEIDSLGGVMGQIADRTGIQFRTLNKSKGPAVWAGRCQSDRGFYSRVALSMVQAEPNIEIIEDLVTETVSDGKKIFGVRTKGLIEYGCKALVLCAGTFLNGLMFTGLKKTPGGRFGEARALGLTESLESLGFVSGRLKTGTPPRIKMSSINYDILIEQKGDLPPEPFSRRTDLSSFPELPQLSCFITGTNPEVHQALKEGFDRSPLYTGAIKGTGPRYCPSIEDKIRRFADKDSHHLFLEPDSLNSDLVYVNGFSTSLPEEIQLKALRRVRGLEKVEIVRPGYAVEYDYFPPYQLDLTLETKLVEGLYFAGQINGTSGYEEAASQGIIAGINAAAKIEGKPELVIKRSQGYIGVLIDDLVGKSTEEPYRMFTSRAEHRLVLRQDNADMRLLEIGHFYGLISSEEFKAFLQKKELVSGSLKEAEKASVKPDGLNNLLESRGKSQLQQADILSRVIKRSELGLKEVLGLMQLNGHQNLRKLLDYPEALKEVEIELKYEGYIKRELDLISKMERLEALKIPPGFDFGGISTLSSESREKLSRIKPRSIGQASRISGVTPSDIAILSVYLKH